MPGSVHHAHQFVVSGFTVCLYDQTALWIFNVQAFQNGFDTALIHLLAINPDYVFMINGNLDVGGFLGDGGFGLGPVDVDTGFLNKGGGSGLRSSSRRFGSFFSRMKLTRFSAPDRFTGTSLVLISVINNANRKVTMLNASRNAIR